MLQIRRPILHLHIFILIVFDLNILNRGAYIIYRNCIIYKYTETLIKKYVYYKVSTEMEDFCCQLS